MEATIAKVIAIEVVKQPQFIIPASLMGIFFGIKVIQEILIVVQQVKNIIRR